MKHTAVLLSPFLLFIALACACASDDPCAGATCDPDELDETSDPGDPPPAAMPCRLACEVLLDECGSGEPAGSSLGRAMASCVDWCEAGGLSADEASCLEALDCEEAPGEACLG